MLNSHCNISSSHLDTQWGTCLACSDLNFGKLGHLNERWLISLSLSWLVYHLNT